MKPQSAIAKGKLLEQHIADRIIAHGLDPKAHRAAGSGNGNREKADINTSLTILGRNAGIECKNQKNIALPAWWKQAQKLEVLGREPILALKLSGEPLEGTVCVIYLETLLSLLQRAQESPGEAPKAEHRSPDQQRELQWAVHNLKSAAAKVEKLLVSKI